MKDLELKARTYSTRVVIDIESGSIIERDSHEYSGPWELAATGGVTGTGIQSPSAQLINTLDALGQKVIYDRLGDLVFKPSPTFWYLNKNAKKYRMGGEIVYPLISSILTTRGAYYGDQLLSVAAIDAITPANQVWRGYFQSVTLPVMDIILGRGGPAGLDLVKVYMQTGSASMLDMLSNAIWGNSPFNSSIDLDNIPNWCTQNNTIAGINRSTSTFWNPAAPQSIGGHLSPTTLLPAYFSVTYGYDEPDVLILNNTDFANFELQFVATNPAAAAPSNLIRAGENLADTAPIQTGLKYHMRFKNAVVLADQYLTAGTGYLLNTNYLWMIYNMNDYFTLTPWIMPSNQNVISTRIHLTTQLGCNRPLVQVQLTNIS